MKRRDFLLSTGAGAMAGLGAIGGAREALADPPKIKKYGTLGRTGLKISDISFGCGASPTPSLLARAADMGINYFDTAPDYGGSELNLGRFIKQRGKRGDLIVATKFCQQGSYPGHLDKSAGKADYVKMVEQSLRRLNTDYIDVIFVHAMGEEGVAYEDRLFDEDMLGAYEQLKKGGKVRFLAVSSHGPVRMEELMMKAVKSGHYDIIMPAHNFMKFPNVPAVVAEAGKRNIGVIAMKTMAGAKDIDLEPAKGEPFAHAAFGYVLRSPHVAGLIITIKNARMLNHYVAASGKPFTQSSMKTLDRYAAMYTKEYCRTGCGECVGACPEKVSVATTLRYSMYFSDYGEEKRAMEAYARLSPNAKKCMTCQDAKCEAACPYELPVASLMRNAHDNLAFTV